MESTFSQRRNPAHKRFPVRLILVLTTLIQGILWAGLSPGQTLAAQVWTEWVHVETHGDFPYKEGLYDIWGSGPNDIYAVGGYHQESGSDCCSDGYDLDYQHAAIWHYDGSSWSLALDKNDGEWVQVGGAQKFKHYDAYFKQIWGSGPDDVYALSVGRLWHYDGNAWSVSLAEVRGEYIGIGGLVSGDFFMADLMSHKFHHYDGSSWNEDDLPFFSPGSHWVSSSIGAPVWASGLDDIYLAYSQEEYMDDGLYHYNGSSWGMITPLDVYSYGVWGAASDDVFVVGDAKGSNTVTICHFDGSSWSSDITGFRNYSCSLHDIWGFSGNDVYAVGEDLILHYDGDSWESMTLPWTPAGGQTDESRIKRIWGSPDGSAVYALTNKAILRLSLEPTPDHYSLSAISSPQKTDQSFSVAIYAEDASDQLMDEYSGDVTMSASGGGIANQTVSLVNGQAAVSLTATQEAQGVQITVSGNGATGTSNSFDVQAPIPVVAAFSASETQGEAPFTVNFQDESQGALIQWQWSFGDGGTSSSQNPSHTYSSQGVYSVTLSVSDGEGQSDSLTKTDYIYVGIPLFGIQGQAIFNDSGLSGVTISLNDGRTQTTDESGAYQFTQVMEGDYTVSPSKQDMQFSPSSRSVHVEGGAVTGVDFTARTTSYYPLEISAAGHHGLARSVYYPGGSSGPGVINLSGTVVSLVSGQPLANAEVYIPGDYPLLYTDAQGNFSIQLDGEGSDPSETMDVNMTFRLPPELTLHSAACTEGDGDEILLPYLTQDFTPANEIPSSLTIQGRAEFPGVGPIPYSTLHVDGPGVSQTLQTIQDGGYQIQIALNGSGQEAQLDYDFEYGCDPTIVEALPDDGLFHDDSAVIPMHADLPALIRVQFGESVPAGETVVFYGPESGPGRLATGDGGFERSLTVTTDAQGIASAYFHATPIVEYTNGAVSLPHAATIRAVHSASGAEVDATVSVGLGVCLNGVDSVEGQSYSFAPETPFGLFVKVGSAFYPDFDLQRYAQNGQNEVWNGKSVGMQLTTQWLNRTDGGDDITYMGACAFLATSETQVLTALEQPTFDAAHNFPAIIMGQDGAHFYRLYLNNILLGTDLSKNESIHEPMLRRQTIIGLSADSETSIYQDLVCSLNATTVTQHWMLNVAKEVPVYGKSVNYFLTVCGLLCDFDKGDYVKAISDLVGFVCGETIDHFNEDLVFAGLGDREKKVVAFGSKAKGWVDYLNDKYKIYQIVYPPPNPNTKSPGIASPYTVDAEAAGFAAQEAMDAMAPLLQEYFQAYELTDYQAVTFWGCADVTLTGGDGAVITATEEFSIQIPQTAYLFYEGDESGGVGVAIMPIDGNYTLSFKPVAPLSRLNVIRGDDSDNFYVHSYTGSAQSVSWHSADNTLYIDLDGDGQTDQTSGGEQTGYGDVDVLPLGEIQGTIRTADGAGAGGIPVNLIRNGAFYTQAVTQSNGSYEFHYVPHGTHVLQPVHDLRTFSPITRTVTVDETLAAGLDFLASEAVVPPDLAVTITGNGSVACESLNCAANCSWEFQQEESVLLIPTAEPGWRFAGWSGACQGLEDCVLTMTEHTEVQALFSPEWWSLFGTNANDIVTGVACDAQGRVYVAGHTKGDGPSQANAGSYDVFLAQHDAQGNRNWMTLMGGEGGDYASDVHVTAQGAVIVAGRTFGVLPGNNYEGQGDMFAASFDANGNLSWVRAYGSAERDIANSVASDPDGNIYIAGYTKGSLNGQPYYGAEDMALIKINGAGAVLWTRLLGTAGGSEIANGAAANAQGVILAGQSYTGVYEPIVARYFSNGAASWHQSFGSASDDRALDVVLDDSGSVYVGGVTNGDLFGEENAGGNDGFISCFNSSGIQQWASLIGTSANDEINYLDIGSLGVYAGGKTQGRFDDCENQGGVDLLAASVDFSGEQRWIKMLGSTMNDAPGGIAVNSDNKVFVSGYTYEALPGTVFQGGSDYPIWMIGEDSNLWIGKDVNGDGQGDVYDVMTMMKVLAGLHPELHPDGDLLRTEKIDAERALYLLKLLNEGDAP